MQLLKIKEENLTADGKIEQAEWILKNENGSLKLSESDLSKLSDELERKMIIDTASDMFDELSGKEIERFVNLFYKEFNNKFSTALTDIMRLCYLHFLGK